VFLIYILPA